MKICKTKTGTCPVHLNLAGWFIRAGYLWSSCGRNILTAAGLKDYTLIASTTLPPYHHQHCHQYHCHHHHCHHIIATIFNTIVIAILNIVALYSSAVIYKDGTLQLLRWHPNNPFNIFAHCHLSRLHHFHHFHHWELSFQIILPKTSNGCSVDNPENLCLIIAGFNFSKHPNYFSAHWPPHHLLRLDSNWLSS